MRSVLPVPDGGIHPAIVYLVVAYDSEPESYYVTFKLLIFIITITPASSRLREYR